MVKRMRPEVKELTYDYTNVNGTSFSSVSYGSGTTMSLLCAGVAQGTGEGQRVGNSIRLIGIKIDFAVTNAESNNIRMFLVKPKAAVPAVGATLIANILSNTSSSTTQWLAPIDTDAYYVYYDKRRFLKPQPLDGNSSSTTSQIAYFRYFQKCRSIMQWNKVGQLLNDYILGCISDSVALPHPGAIAGYVRLYYTDN